MSGRVLHVVRDRAHLIKGALTAAEFFALFALHPSNDSSANYVVAQWLSEHEPHELRRSFEYTRLYNSLIHGLCSPKEILERIHHENGFRVEVIKRLAQMGLDERKTGFIVPERLKSYSKICTHYLVDLSELELDILFRLSELGMPVEMILPIDESERGMTLPVSYLADRVERRHDLLHMEISFEPIEISAPIHVYRGSDLMSEARFVAQTISDIRQQAGDEVSIALGLRVLDDRALFFKDALRKSNIPICERKGELLSKSCAAYFVLSKLKKEAKNLAFRLGSDIPQHASLKEFQSLALEILGNESMQGHLQLREKLQREIDATTSERGTISLLGYISWLEKSCSQETLPVTPCDKNGAVELLPLPELLGRQFDYVVVADLVHGRCPQNPQSSSLFSDSDRFWLNHLMKRPVLRLYEENPLETSLVPPRQALEPMWFIGACASAKKGLILTTSERDERGREQANSEFFDILESADTLEFLGLSLRERQLTSPPAPLHQVERGAKIDAEVFRKRFAPRLGLTPEHPLTPTRIEALAVCPFRGYVEKILHVDTSLPMGNDMDVRRIGRLAHEALEKYYSSGAQNRRAVSLILQECAQKYWQGESQERQTVWRAHVKWLGTTLERLVSVMASDPPVIDVEPVAFEKSVMGVPLPIGQERIYFGGVIDRVDEGPHARVVVDYKTSTQARSEQKISEKELLVTHFQLPLYLRLLEHYQPSSSTTELLAYLIAIRDGVASSVLGRDSISDIRRRVTDDTAEDGLAKSLERLLKPILEGDVSPRPGDICRGCRLGRVCRVSA